jgi:hypothetical protein
MVIGVWFMQPFNESLCWWLVLRITTVSNIEFTRAQFSHRIIPKETSSILPVLLPSFTQWTVPEQKEKMFKKWLIKFWKPELTVHFRFWRVSRPGINCGPKICRQQNFRPFFLIVNKTFYFSFEFITKCAFWYTAKWRYLWLNNDVTWVNFAVNFAVNEMICRYHWLYEQSQSKPASPIIYLNQSQSAFFFNFSILH